MHLSKTTLFKISCGAVIIIANYLFFSLLSWDLNPHYWRWWAITLFLVIAWSWFGLLATAEDRTWISIPAVRLKNSRLLNKTGMQGQGWTITQSAWTFTEFRRIHLRKYNPFRHQTSTGE